MESINQNIYIMDSIKALNFFKGIKGSASLVIAYYTNPTGTKTVKKHKQLEKYNKLNVGFGHDYEAKVNRQLEKDLTTQAREILASEGNNNPDLVVVQKLVEELRTEKFKSQKLHWAMRVPNTKLLINKKIVEPNYKELQAAAIKNNTLDAFFDEMNKKCLALPLETIAENAQIMLFKEPNRKAIETRYYETFEAGKRTEIKYEDIKVGIHVTDSFFKEKSTVGRGSVSKENSFVVFTPYLKNLCEFTFAKKSNLLEPSLLR